MVQSVDRAMVILDYLRDAPRGMGVTEISKKLGVAKSTVHRLLSTLEEHRYVKKVNDDGIYQLGLKFLEMNQSVVENLDIVELAHPLLEKLTSTVSEITHLVMLEGKEIIYIDKVESFSTVRIYSQTGRRAPIYCTGVGKAIAAYLPDSKLADYLSLVQWKQHTENTIATEEAFRKELHEIRQRGYAIDNEEHEAGIRCLAAPVFDHVGQVKYAISTTGPLSRMSDERLKELIPLVVECADNISEAIGYKKW